MTDLFLLLTGLVSIYLLWRFYTRWSKSRALYDVYYIMAFLVLLVSGLLLIFLGMGILKSPYVLTVASLIPLGISMGLVEEYFPKYKRIFKWFALIGFLAIAISAFLTITAIPLTFSIANGLAFGFAAFTFLRTLQGRHREINWLMYALTALFLLRFFYLAKA